MNNNGVSFSDLSLLSFPRRFFLFRLIFSFMNFYINNDKKYIANWLEFS